jgi:hypothetical protein
MITTNETILNPKQTQIRFDCWLRDTDNISEPNGYGEYVFTVQPVSVGDHQLIFEAGATAQSQVEMSLDPYSSKVVRNCYESKMGEPVFSQLFQPIVAPEMESWELMNRQASITAHFRDSVDGKVFLQADYIDVYDPLNGCDEEGDHTLHPNYDPLDDEF